MKSSEQLISFTEDLAVLLNAGSDLDSALAMMLKSHSDSSIRSVLTQLRVQVRKGVLLSSALSEQPRFFDNYFVGMVRSGEVSGKLAKALEELAQQLETKQDLKNQINNALIYPAILCLAMALSLMLVVGVILPKLTTLFESFGGDLSFAAQVLLVIGQFINAWGKPILVAVALLILSAYFFQDVFKPKQRMLSALNSVPFIRRLLSQIEFARFTSTLSSLLDSGVSQVEALTIAAESFEDANNRQQIDYAIVQIKEGKTLSLAIKSVDGFGELYSHSIESGEQAGQLAKTLAVLSQRLEKDFSRRAQRLASMVEPILIIALGLVIGVIILTVFSALQTVGDLPL